MRNPVLDMNKNRFLHPALSSASNRRDNNNSKKMKQEYNFSGG